MHESGHSEGTFLNLNDNARKGGIPSCSFSGFRRLTAPVPVSLCGVSCAPSGGSAHSWGTLHLGHYVGTRRSPRHPDGRLPSSCCSWVSTIHKWPVTQRHIGAIPGPPGSKDLSKGVSCAIHVENMNRHPLLQNSTQNLQATCMYTIVLLTWKDVKKISSTALSYMCLIRILMWHIAFINLYDIWNLYEIQSSVYNLNTLFFVWHCWT
jgi:hypothetical protein